MIPGETRASPRVQVVPATAEQEPVLANLLELYVHDFSQLLALNLGENGRYGYPGLRSYWQEAGRFPFLIREEGALAGFALVKRGPAIGGGADVFDMAEFFVARGCRRRGVGAEAAHQVWRRLPGLWEIRVMRANAAALGFWERAIGDFAGQAVPAVPFESGNRSWMLFQFQSADPAPQAAATEAIK